MEGLKQGSTTAGVSTSKRDRKIFKTETEEKVRKKLIKTNNSYAED